jgi:hypothetical protein
MDHSDAQRAEWEQVYTVAGLRRQIETCETDDKDEITAAAAPLAITAATEAIAISRELADDKPSVYNSVLEDSLLYLSVILSQVANDRLEALPPLEEAIQIQRQRSTDDPTQRDHLADLLEYLSEQLVAVGKLEEAVPPAEEATAIREQLAEEDPARRPKHAELLKVLSERLAAVNRTDEAALATARATQITAEVSSDSPAA